MTVIPAEEAAKQLYEILDRVEAGEQVSISRRGKIVATVAAPAAIPPQVEDVTLEVRKIRTDLQSREIGASVSEILDALHTGRR